MSQFEVTVSKTVIQSVVITVDAESSEQAEDLALDAAQEVSQDQWSVYDYNYDVVDVYDREAEDK